MKQRHLIILRGVPGAGKSQVSRVLVGKLGADATSLDLDRHAPDVETAQFEEALTVALGFKYVIGELYSGRWHTSDPSRWVEKFREGYEIYSFVLDVSLQRGYENCRDPRHPSYHPSSIEEYAQRYNRFYEWQSRNLLASNADIQREILLDANDGDWERIASTVLEIRD